MEISRPQERQADLPYMQRRRIRARHLQGQAFNISRPAQNNRGNNVRLLRNKRRTGFHIYKGRIHKRVQNPSKGHCGSARARLCRQKYLRFGLLLRHHCFARGGLLCMRRRNGAHFLPCRGQGVSAHKAAVFPCGKGALRLPDRSKQC